MEYVIMKLKEELRNTKLLPQPMGATWNNEPVLPQLEKAIEILTKANGVDTRTEPALPIQNVSRWAYLYDNAKPLMIGFIASMLLSTTYKLIETIIIKIALIVNG